MSTIRGWRPFAADKFNTASLSFQGSNFWIVLMERGKGGFDADLKLFRVLFARFSQVHSAHLDSLA